MQDMKFRAKGVGFMVSLVDLGLKIKGEGLRF